MNDSFDVREGIINNFKVSLTREELEIPISEEEMLVVNRLLTSLLRKRLSDKSPSDILYWVAEGLSYRTLKHLRILKYLSYRTGSTKFVPMYLGTKIYDFIGRDEIESLSFSWMVRKYCPRLNRATVGRKDSFVRNGFKHTDGVQWGYYIPAEHKDSIVSAVVADIIESEDSSDTVSYKEVASVITKGLEGKDALFNRGTGKSDSRGRNIPGDLSKVFSGTNSNLSRSCLRIPVSRQLTVQGVRAVHLFIAAEVYGNQPYASVAEKEVAGKFAYDNWQFPANCSLAKRIWLERIYNRGLFEGAAWDVPIELDQGASGIAVIGLLLGLEDLLERTNYLVEDGLKSPWRSELEKKAVTPFIYGSQASFQKLWRKNGLDFSDSNIAEVKVQAQELTEGVFGKLKKLILSSRPGERQNVFTTEAWTVQASKKYYQPTGRVTVKKVKYYNPTKDEDCVLERHTPQSKLLPEQFARFFLSGLIHNVDSILIDSVITSAISNGVEWMLDIHDALLVHPNDAGVVRECHREASQNILNNGCTIVRKYLVSLGVSQEDINELLSYERFSGELPKEGLPLK